MPSCFRTLLFCSLFLLPVLSCSKDAGNADGPGGKTAGIPVSLKVSGPGIEYGEEGVQMVPAAEGIWDIYADFFAGESVRIAVPGGEELLSLRVTPAKEGICRLRVNAVDKKWELTKIDKVSLVATEGGEDAAPIEAVYSGRGVWTAKGLYIAHDYLKYRYLLETDNPSSLKYWCASWDNSGQAPEVHSAEYLRVRALGQKDYDALFLKDNRACWMFPADKVKLLADFSISMNEAVPVQEISYSSPHTGPKAVFIGDSITWQWARASRTDSKGSIVIPLNPLPSFMKESGDNVITSFHPQFFTQNDYVNKGISAENTTQMLARYKPDVLDLDPHCVVIMGGTNDLAQGYAKSKIMENLSAMAEQADAAGIKVILCSVTPCNDTYSRLSNPSTKGAHIIELNGMIRTYAGSKDFTYCDYWPLLVASDGLALREDFRLYDNLHPNPAAYTVMEALIKQTIEDILKQ